MNNETQEFELHAAWAFFDSAWVDACDVSDNSQLIVGKEIMACMPTELDPAAVHAARTLRMDMERANGCTVVQMLREIEKRADGDRAATMEYFGHYSAMQAMGHGVGLYDAFGAAVDEAIKVPYVEFSQCSLERDYF